MILSKEQLGELNHFGSDIGGHSLEVLAKIAFDYYSRQAVLADGNEIIRHQGAARFADWLSRLPQAIKEREV